MHKPKNTGAQNIGAYVRGGVDAALASNVSFSV
jgi:hypothetical protein